MKDISFVIEGAPVTKKNSQRIIINRGRPMVLPSKQFKEYEAKACEQLKDLGIETIYYPVNVQAIYYMPTRRRVDLTNLHEALHDILVKAGVLEDDNCKIIGGTDGSRVKYCKEDPRTEVVITPMEDYVPFSEE